MSRRAAIVHYDEERDAFYINLHYRRYVKPLHGHAFTDGERVYRSCDGGRSTLGSDLLYVDTAVSFLEPIGVTARNIVEYRRMMEYQ